MIFNRTKVIATIGPSCSQKTTLKKMLQQGVNAFRINMSHGDKEAKQSLFETINSLKTITGEKPCVVADLAGPKIRVRSILPDFHLKKKQKVNIVSGGKADVETIGVSKEIRFTKVEKGARIKINDGKIQLKVLNKKSAHKLECITEIGGLVEDGKGVNFPGVVLGLPALTKQDKEDLKLAIQEKADWVALSFVRTANDKNEIDKILKKHNAQIPVIAKIEKWEAIQELDNIVKKFDAVMVARGDLGVEMPQAQVPLMQKKIIEKANKQGKPVIIATQMLESMISEPVPTRAEVNDIANAIFDGADALMVTGETAMGNHPLEVIKVLKNVIVETERTIDFDTVRQKIGSKNTADAISRATSEVAQDLNIKCIVTMTHSGSTARMIARYRPNRRIVALTPRPETSRRLSIVWGVTPFIIKKYQYTDDIPTIVGKELLERKLLKIGEKYVVTGGVPTGISGTTNYLSIHTI